MDERIVQFRVGVMVLATMIIAGMLVILFKDFSGIAGQTYTVNMRFQEAPGIAEETPVRKSGMLIGRVKSVTFDDATGDVLITATIMPNRVKKHDTPFITASLLGDAAIEFMGPINRNPNAPPVEFVEDGTQFDRGLVQPQPLEMLSKLEGRLAGAADSISQTSDQWSEVGKQVETLLTDNREQLNKVVMNADRTLQSVQQTMLGAQETLKKLDTTLNSTNQLIADPELTRGWKQTMAQLPQAMDEARMAIASVQKAMVSMERTVDSTEQTLKHLEGFTKPLGEKGEALVAKIDSGAEQMNVLITQLARFSKDLNNPNGTLNLLVNNPELYQHLASSASNIDQLVRDLRPIINDARVFADKIARHPELIGVRGAVSGSSGIK